VDVRPLVTHEFSLERIADAFKAADQDPAAIKVVVKTP
jgi:threonine dehydrogenase-like Zn-dependent dehydrogenase